MFPEVITGALKNTVVFTVLGFALGLAIALVVALMRLSSVGVYRWLATIYIEFFRGLPALVVFLVMDSVCRWPSRLRPPAARHHDRPDRVLRHMAETIRAVSGRAKGQMRPPLTGYVIACDVRRLPGDASLPPRRTSSFC